MEIIRGIAISLAMLLPMASSAGVQALEKKVLSFAAARKIAAVAADAARAKGVGGVIAVVDDGGHLILLHRLDDTQVASVNVGIGEARTAAIQAWNDSARMIAVAGVRAEALGAFGEPKLGRVEFDERIHRSYSVNGSALVEINQRFHGWGRDHYYRDVWMCARRDGRWWLVRCDYEPQPPFDTRR